MKKLLTKLASQRGLPGPRWLSWTQMFRKEELVEPITDQSPEYWVGKIPLEFARETMGLRGDNFEDIWLDAMSRYEIFAFIGRTADHAEIARQVVISFDGAFGVSVLDEWLNATNLCIYFDAKKGGAAAGANATLLFVPHHAVPEDGAAFTVVCPKCRKGDRIQEMNQVIVYNPVERWSEDFEPIFTGESLPNWDTSQPAENLPRYRCANCSEEFSLPAFAVEDQVVDRLAAEAGKIDALQPGKEFSVWIPGGSCASLKAREALESIALSRANSVFLWEVRKAGVDLEATENGEPAFTRTLDEALEKAMPEWKLMGKPAEVAILIAMQSGLILSTGIPAEEWVEDGGKGGA